VFIIYLCTVTVCRTRNRAA